MKCFNHPDRDAVAACVDCGKGLCRECAEKYRPILCDECFETRMERSRRNAEAARQERVEASKQERNETATRFIVNGIIGALIGLLLLLFAGSDGTPGGFGVFLFGFCIPYGWQAVGLKETILVAHQGGGGFIIWLLVRALISAVIGIFAFFYLAYRTFWLNRKYKETKSIAAGASQSPYSSV